MKNEKCYWKSKIENYKGKVKNGKENKSNEIMNDNKDSDISKWYSNNKVIDSNDVKE